MADSGAYDFAAHTRLDLDQPAPAQPVKRTQPAVGPSFALPAKLEPFILLAKSARGGGAAALISQAVAAPGVYVFSELLEQQSIKDLATHEQYQQQYRLLELFAYGTWEDYVANRDSYPALTSDQETKLKQLSVLTLATQCRHIPYSTLLSSLSVPDVPALEGLLVSCFDAELLNGRLDQKTQRLEVLAAPERDVRPAPSAPPVEIGSRKRGRRPDDSSASQAAVRPGTVKPPRATPEAPSPLPSALPARSLPPRSPRTAAPSDTHDELDLEDYDEPADVTDRDYRPRAAKRRALVPTTVRPTTKKARNRFDKLLCQALLDSMSDWEGAEVGQGALGEKDLARTVEKFSSLVDGFNATSSANYNGLVFQSITATDVLGVLDSWRDELQDEFGFIPLFHRYDVQNRKAYILWTLAVPQNIIEYLRDRLAQRLAAIDLSSPSALTVANLEEHNLLLHDIAMVTDGFGRSPPCESVSSVTRSDASDDPQYRQFRYRNLTPTVPDVLDFEEYFLSTGFPTRDMNFDLSYVLEHRPSRQPIHYGMKVYTTITLGTVPRNFDLNTTMNLLKMPANLHQDWDSDKVAIIPQKAFLLALHGYLNDLGDAPFALEAFISYLETVALNYKHTEYSFVALDAAYEYTITVRHGLNDYRPYTVQSDGSFLVITRQESLQQLKSTRPLVTDVWTELLNPLLFLVNAAEKILLNPSIRDDLPSAYEDDLLLCVQLFLRLFSKASHQPELFQTAVEAGVRRLGARRPVSEDDWMADEAS
ncbi:hypothetical protein JCM8097_001569 [Rhodosporidiobolus ruineniae]